MSRHQDEEFMILSLLDMTPQAAVVAAVAVTDVGSPHVPIPVVEDIYRQDL